MSTKNKVQELVAPILDLKAVFPEEAVRWRNYMELKKKAYRDLTCKELQAHLVSEVNWMMRNRAKSCEQFRVKIHVGDICYIDFGPAYLNEAGFQHFGLVLSIMNSKAFVIPMTSNASTYRQAYDPKNYPYGKKHLMKLGMIPGMKKESVLFLNDCKYINTARIIDVKAHLDTSDELFQEIKKRVLESLLA